VRAVPAFVSTSVILGNAAHRGKCGLGAPARPDENAKPGFSEKPGFEIR
jgi:hypothetical protein